MSGAGGPAVHRAPAAGAEGQPPEPKVNHPIGPYVVDFAWLDHRVLVETDGYATHGDYAAFETDRARDAYLQAHGFLVLRFTWSQISQEPLTVVARLAQTLGQRRSAA